jgi:hypothetical protein
MSKGNHNKRCTKKIMIGDGKVLFLVREQLIDCTYISIRVFIKELILQKSHAHHNNLFTVIDSFQRYIHSDKSIVLNKGK